MPHVCIMFRLNAYNPVVNSKDSCDELGVLCLWKPGDDLLAYLQEGLQDFPIELIIPRDLELHTLLKLAPKADVLLGWRPSREVIDAAMNLKLIINPGAGVQHLVQMMQEVQSIRDIILVNGHGNSVFTAEHTVAMILALLNGLVPHHNAMAGGQWRKGDDFLASVSLNRRTVGLLGYGHVNRKVHTMLSGFGCSVHVANTSGIVEPMDGLSVDSAWSTKDLDAFLSAIDTLVIAVPQTDETIDMFGSRQLELLAVTPA